MNKIKIIKISLAILLFAILIAIIIIIYTKQKEGFNDQAGTLCYSCTGKTFNECNSCFNCGFCVDAMGNSKCVPGDYKGPYNYEKCAEWYNGDPYSHMMQINKRENEKCQYDMNMDK